MLNIRSRLSTPFCLVLPLSHPTPRRRSAEQIFYSFPQETIYNVTDSNFVVKGADLTKS